MTSFKRFIAVWFGIVIAATLLMSGAIIWLANQDTAAEKTNGNDSVDNHFSVVYRGFVSDYSTSYLDYYITINELKDDPLRMYLQIYLKNQEASGYYFMIDQHEPPPAGWTISPSYIGLVGVDEGLTYTYSDIYRLKPASIPAGEFNETINLVVKAYHDSSYTNFYSQDNFTVTYHFIDRTSAAWTVIEYDSFDGGDYEGWGGASLSLSTDYYRSFRYSLRSYDYQQAVFSKSFSIVSPYTKGYLICPIRLAAYSAEIRISIDGQISFKSDIAPPAETWYQYTIPLHFGPSSVSIAFYRYATSMYAYMDDVYVIAK